jgi:thymidylate synthase (FAD)
MEVRIIDYTGAGSPDPYHAARLLMYVKDTRLKRGSEAFINKFGKSEPEVEQELKEIVKSIRSSWEFVDVTIELIGVSRACADQILRTRHGSYAVQAMRVADMAGFETVVPPSVLAHEDALQAWYKATNAIDEAYQALQALGIPNQDARGVLPMAVMTNLNIKWNLRTLAETCAKRQSVRAQGEYREFVELLKHELYMVWPWAQLFIEPERTRTPAMDKILLDMLGHAGPMDKPLVNAAGKELDLLKGTWG